MKSLFVAKLSLARVHAVQFYNFGFPNLSCLAKSEWSLLLSLSVSISSLQSSRINQNVWINHILKSCFWVNLYECSRWFLSLKIYECDQQWYAHDSQASGNYGQTLMLPFSKELFGGSASLMFTWPTYMVQLLTWLCCCDADGTSRTK